jgi:uncharacterized protein
MKILLVLCLALCSAVARAEMPRVTLNIGMYRVDAEVALNGPDREQGLMQRRTLASQRGMLFIFPELARHCMWMKNTLLPLSVAFLDEQGRIINIEDMKPQTEDNHCAAQPARYALEMNRGWFKQHGIAPGQAISSNNEKLPPVQ